MKTIEDVVKKNHRLISWAFNFYKKKLYEDGWPIFIRQPDDPYYRYIDPAKCFWDYPTIDIHSNAIAISFEVYDLADEFVYELMLNETDNDEIIFSGKEDYYHAGHFIGGVKVSIHIDETTETLKFYVDDSEHCKIYNAVDIPADYLPESKHEEK